MGSMSDGDMNSGSSSGGGTIDPYEALDGGAPAIPNKQSSSSKSNLHSAEHDLESVFDEFERRASQVSQSPSASKSPSASRHVYPPLANNGAPVEETFMI